MAASSSLAGNDKCEVFISFRGSDVRRGFLSHLYPALTDKQIHAFIDNDLERGQDITRNLFRIIEQSDLSIVIFSQNYPESEWCLEELEKILESMRQRKQIVVPVFYEVNPSDVQGLKGNYAVELQKWRDALVEISNLSGFDSRNSINDAKLIEDIVVNVYNKLSENCPTITREYGLFGIDSRIKDVESLLRLDLTDDVRMVGIWGMGGIGKTTIATKVFDKIKNNFYSHCFMSNARETNSRDGPTKLRDKIMHELLKDKNLSIDSPFSVDNSIRRRLKHIKVLLVLDDVHTFIQLNSLLESSGLYSSESFCSGSRIIVTSRDSQVLRDVKLKSYVYKANELKDIEALHLLCWHAFGQNYPQQGYEKLAEKAVRYAHGVPLALMVLGSELKFKATCQWEDALKKFNIISPFEIQKILRISFDGLDRDEKNVFLDKACYLKGKRRDYVEDVLEAFGFHEKTGIDRLIDKSLLKEEKANARLITIGLTENMYGTITMHDLLEQMGQEIVQEEKESKGKQSRLWTYDDIKDAFTNNWGIENVEAISQGYRYGDKIYIGREAFMPMSNLRFLHLSDENIDCPTGLEFLPDSIKHLSWDYYSLGYLPSNHNAQKLVHLELQGSQLQEINWSKPLQNLKCIDLDGSDNLMKISDLAMAPKLETLLLSGCRNLVEVGSSLANLNKLTLLDVSGCERLSNLPDLSSSIEQLDLKASGLRGLPSTIWCLTHLKKLSLKCCYELESLPSCISNMSSLEKITLIECSNLQKLPGDFGNLKSLKELDASYRGLRKLPPSIQNLKKLTRLKLCGCRDLIKLPKDFGNLESLEELDASYSGLTEFPASIQNLKKLIKLDLSCCEKIESLPSLPSNLQFLYARGCISLLNEVPCLCVNGSQVPKWMMYRNECGSSVSLELQTLGHSMNFVFCSVLSAYDPAFDCFNYLDVPAVLQSDEISKPEHSFDMVLEDYFYVDDSSEAFQMFLWTGKLDCGYAKSVLFNFKTFMWKRKIIKCGVHPISYNKNYRKRTHSDEDKDPNVDLDLHLSLFNFSCLNPDFEIIWSNKDPNVDLDLHLSMFNSSCLNPNFKIIWSEVPKGAGFNLI